MLQHGIRTYADLPFVSILSKVECDLLIIQLITIINNTYWPAYVQEVVYSISESSVLQMRTFHS